MEKSNYKFFFFVFLVTFVQATDTSTTADQQLEFSNIINRFSQKFYKGTSVLIPGKNLITSPLSAEIALAFLSLGATGATLKELNEGLCLPSQNFTRSAFKTAIEKLNAVEGVTLSIANKLFVKEGRKYVLSPQFKKDAVDVFQSEAENVDFLDSQNTAHIINTWVEKKTNDKIKNLIKPNHLTNSTRVLLVNAIYFKGAWKEQFNKGSTWKSDFFLSATNKIQVDVMHKIDNFRYGDVPEWDARILELPYEKSQASLVVILPNKVDGLAALEEKLAAKDADIHRQVQKLHSVLLDVALPKFKIETEIDLKELLRKIGITKIFNDNAELGGLLVNDEELVVSKAVQKVFIEVNEDGAEAAAASHQNIGSGGGLEIPFLKFKATHPFVFNILDKNTRTALFVGRFLPK